MGTYNKANIKGKALTDFEYDHTAYGQTFCQTTLEIKRPNGKWADKVKVIAPDSTIKDIRACNGMTLDVKGEFRSFRRLEGVRKRLVIFIFATQIDAVEDLEQANEIELTGRIIGTPDFREKMNGTYFCTFLLEVRRGSIRGRHKNFDYIPCVAWSSRAKEASRLYADETIKVTGQAGSREYKKYHDDGTFDIKTAYEMTIQEMEVIKENGDGNKSRD